jgi:glycosyltransferase involved in cell wall biosynthesis
LLVSYCFPPDRTVGAIRWQKLARFAAEYGWRLDVITLDPGDEKLSDHRGLGELPAGTHVFGVPLKPPAIERFERWASALRSRSKASAPSPLESGAAAPDRRAAGPPPSAPAAGEVPKTLAVDGLRWVPRSVRDVLRAYFAWVQHARLSHWADDAAKLAVELGRDRPYSVLISSGPPHATHEAVRLASRRLGVPYVLDLRDPWSHTQRLPESLASPLFLTLARRDERRGLRDAALVVANTEALRGALTRDYPPNAGRIVAVRNGCDEDPIPAGRLSRVFTIRFAGTVYFERDPRMLFRAAAVVIRDLQLQPAGFRLEFMGAFDTAGGFPMSAIARDEGVGAFLSVGPTRPHREALEFFAGATMLVTFPGYNSAMTIPAKTFEYVRFDAWILAMTEPDTPLAQLLAGTGADVVSPDDVASIAGAIRKRYLEHASGSRPRALAADGRFGRAEQAAILFNAIDRIAR